MTLILRTLARMYVGTFLYRPQHNTELLDRAETYARPPLGARHPTAGSPKGRGLDMPIIRLTTQF